jgi:hypothetical protein
MSADGKNWKPVGLRNVTGKLPGNALVLASLKAVHDHKIDLWDYVEFLASKPLRFELGASTVCAIAAPAARRSG